MSTELRQATSSYQLEAMLPDSCVLRWYHAVLCGLSISLFLLLSYLPVSSQATWASVVKGQSRLALTERFPLSIGMRSFESGWASHEIIAGLNEVGGAELLSFTLASIQTLVLIGWTTLLFRIGGPLIAIVGSLVMIGNAFIFTRGLDPSTFGQIAFFALALLLSKSMGYTRPRHCWCRASKFNWIAIALLFSFWANVDLSFLIGLAWLGCFAVSVWVDRSIRHGWRIAFRSHEFRSRVLLFEIATAATLVNPQGWRLWEAFVWTQGNPLVGSLGQWTMTPMASLPGAFVMIGWTVWVALSRRSQTSAFVMATPLLATVGVAFNPSLLVWLAPSFLLSIAVLNARSTSPEESVGSSLTTQSAQPKPLRFVFTLTCGLMIWMGFSFSPWGSAVLGGKQRSEVAVVGANLPIGLSEHLKERPPASLMCCPIHWSDWLQTRVKIPLMVGSDQGVIPRSVLNDYRSIYRGQTAWPRIAEKYSLDGIIIDKADQQVLIRKIRRGVPSWEVTYEDEQSILLEKKR
ncbi:hypothetical protein [Roseiconus lacunae]|uniref:Glycosyltransferase RgtA/B/C/D-like domain-containing protein n=1 Tax=Roseiconus lacunae TaxID=2605694 RepID=A0ABT7PLQ7_9BACT|nr:hypothetical protein [Roseiconus lacunae]MDM4017209.1 hypothetical protein [Roseiconus lacunae]